MIPRFHYDHNALSAIALLLAIACPHGVNAEPTAQEVMDRSQEQMKPPIRYHVQTKNVRLIIFEKIMPDGSLARRVETTLPMNKIAISVGTDSYEIYPDHNLAVDMHFMHKQIKEQTALFSSIASSGDKTSVTLNGTVVRDKKECFEVISTLSQPLTSAIENALPPTMKGLALRGTRLLIDKKTYHIVETQDLRLDESVGDIVEFRDISHPAELADDLFLPASGLEIKKPKSTLEYIDLLSEAFRSRSPTPRAPAASEIIGPPRTDYPFQRQTLGAIEVDASTGKPIPPVPAGMNRTEFDRAIAERRDARRKEASLTEQSKRNQMSTPRRIGIGLSLFSIVFLSTVIIYRRFRQNHIYRR